MREIIESVEISGRTITLPPKDAALQNLAAALNARLRALDTNAEDRANLNKELNFLAESDVALGIEIDTIQGAILKLVEKEPANG